MRSHRISDLNVFVLIAIALVQSRVHPATEGGNVGNYDLSGLFYLIAWAAIIDVFGITLCIVSLTRKEQGFAIGVATLFFYLLPVLWAGEHYLQFLTSRAAYQRYEKAHSQ